MALAFAAAFWQPRRLQLARLPDEAHALHHLPSVAAALEHLELQLHLPPPQPALAALAAAPHLRCLSLRGCIGLTDASLAALASCRTLQALDLGGLAQLTDEAAHHAARLPRLEQLNLSGAPRITDRALEALTYGQRLAAWAGEQEQQPAQAAPPEAAATLAAWPPLPLRVLRLAGCGVTPTGLLHLRDLPALALLDVRYTRMPRAALQPLEQRFGLRLVQGAVLASSNALAAAVVNYDAVACSCGGTQEGEARVGWLLPTRRRL